MADLRTTYVSGGGVSESDPTKKTSTRDDLRKYTLSSSSKKKSKSSSYVPKTSETDVTKGTSTVETKTTATP